MFNKLLSNLPFNPSLINQVAFYAHRLKKEGSVRRLGLLFVVLAMSLQLFAIMAPPKPSLARTGNDIIPGGFSSVSQIIGYCNNNTYGLKTILKYFGIPCANLNGPVVTLGSRDYNNQLYSMGRIAYGKVGEKPVTIPYAGTFYMRPLWSWDTGGESHYKALAVGNVFTAKFWLLFNCGNLVKIGPPTTPKPPTIPPPKPPVIPPCTIQTCIKLSKSARNTTRNVLNANGTTAQPNDIINYTLTVKNVGKSTVQNFVVEENLTDVLEYAKIVDLHGGSLFAQNIVRWPAVNIAAGATVNKFITIQVKSSIPTTPTPGANPGSFDCIMTNVYGIPINIKVPCSVVKKTEKVVTTTLPNTGPGTTIAVGFGITSLVAYFYARNRLLNKELDILRKEYNNSGGN